MAAQPMYMNVDEYRKKGKGGGEPPQLPPKPGSKGASADGPKIHGADRLAREEQTIYTTIQPPPTSPGMLTAPDMAFAFASEDDRVMYASLDLDDEEEEAAEAPPPDLPSRGYKAEGIFSLALWKDDKGGKGGKKVTLHFASKSLTMSDAGTGAVIYEWKTNTIRAYGQKAQRFVIETGKGAVSGPATFRFDLEDKTVDFAAAMRSKPKPKT
mmetsp:Transcript_1783/g.4527  ORF Transcript_1783/g.4527 Transcript_1783/m.4527 type:complete len:212 (-) Transcript_1783:67-702(-)|eukprot:CAMPEP_0182926742 /NCGR_PEP_ID=MMETSP0105_2-20130417/12241_1 /TAXON_ID=81532 ORGANISM="Acanthoeca-like sp., Strain 10tr" /NCGR_SAMPLE_ID=MMETSP0105_2 /ASSEMBLY_ACC=CAM_ASM_000205 /LENGTH=211 /DNA_ID=CAMNT_0025064651 /DNA_START=115 /DNA_END=750 /DNA_ORIENTATION=+